MDLNGMTEEEYLNNLFEQAATDMPKDNEDASEQEFVDFLDSFSAVDGSPADTEEEAAADMILNSAVAAPDNSEEASDKKDKKSLKNKKNERKAKKKEAKAEARTTKSSKRRKTEEENDNKTSGDDAFKESLDSIIDELGNMNSQITDDSEDIFAQIANSELPQETTSDSDDYSELLDAVDSIMDDEKDSVQYAGDYDDISDKSGKAKKKSSKKNKKPKKGFMTNVKEFLIEQGEDTPEEIAEAEEKAAAKAEKKAAKAEAKAEKKAAKAEKKEAKAAAKAEAKEKKALERQIKKEEKRAAKEADKEPKYIVTVVKVALLITVVAAFGIVLWALGDYNERRLIKKNAAAYFLAGEYELAYEEIAAIRPEDTEEVLYEQIRTIMYVQKQYNSYLNFYNISMKEEALDALIKGVDKYDKYYENASELGIVDDMNVVLAKIIKELNDTFGISEEKARAISNIEDPVEYSIELRNALS